MSRFQEFVDIYQRLYAYVYTCMTYQTNVQNKQKQGNVTVYRNIGGESEELLA